MEKKITKKEYFENIKNIISNSEEANKLDLIEFVDKQIELINTKAIKAKEKAEEKRNNADELKNMVLSILTEDYQSIDEILNKIDLEDVTKAKVVARLTQLVKSGEVKKEQTRNENNKRIMTYAVYK